MLPSLLDFQPQDFGLPPFADRVAGTVVLDPVWRLRGTVVHGFGRGSKVPPSVLSGVCLVQPRLSSLRRGHCAPH